jgi:hypothetical protein
LWEVTQVRLESKPFESSPAFLYLASVTYRIENGIDRSSGRPPAVGQA